MKLKKTESFGSERMLSIAEAMVEHANSTQHLIDLATAVWPGLRVSRAGFMPSWTSSSGRRLLAKTSKSNRTMKPQPVEAPLSRFELGESTLSNQESDQLYDCEKVIEKGLDTFVEVGQALAEIRDCRLYRYQYSSFEQYVRERWKMSARHAHRLVDGAEIASNLLPPPAGESGPPPGVTNWSPPTSESQVRPLKGLEPAEAKKVWHEAIKSAQGGQVTARDVQEARARFAGADRTVEVEMERVQGGDIDQANCHEALAATREQPELIVHIKRTFSFEGKLWVVSVGHFGGSPPDNAVVTHDAHELLIPSLYKGPEKPEFAHGRMVSLGGTAFRLGPKVVFCARGKAIRRQAAEEENPPTNPEFKLEVVTTHKPGPYSEIGFQASVLIKDAIALQEFAKGELSTKQLLHLSIALTHLKNFRASIEQAADPRRKMREVSQRGNAKALKIAKRKSLVAAAKARWKKVRAFPNREPEIPHDSNLFVLCRVEKDSGRSTFRTKARGWTTDPNKAETFPNATAAKFSANHVYDKPMRLETARRKVAL